MQPDQAPCTASGRVEFPPSITSCLRDQRDEASPLLGGIFSDTKLAWLSKGPLLEVVRTSDSSKISAWTFGAVVRDFKTKVTCITELPHFLASGVPGPVNQLLVGLECELTGGMVCLFNLAGSRVLRAINIPSKVTAIDVVTLGKTTEPLHQCFKTMSGIAAVGTNDGQILLIDIRRKDCDEALRSGHSTHWEGLRDELQSCGLIPLKNASTKTLEEYPDEHLYLHLNERYLMKHQRLVVQLPAKEDTFLPEDPSITSLLYVPQLASLCVGFAFGSFQIWSLESLSLVYTLPVNDPNPVVKLSFQEACDDPNAYCYLWAVRGGLNSNNSVNDLDHPVTVFGPPTATMFSLCYNEKVWLQDYGHFYKNFMLCSSAFEYDLSGGKDSVGGRLISLYSVSRNLMGLGGGPSPPEDSCSLGPSTNSLNLSLIVWETWGPTGPSSSANPVNTHLSLFDINQWYVDQMPSRLSQRGGPSRNRSIASYLVSYNLGNVISTSGGALLDIRVNTNTLVPFSSVQNVEEFSRPSSLSFDSEVLMERQVVHVKHPGVQRALLSTLISTGPSALMTPTNLFHECLALGLRPLLLDITSAMNVPLDEQRTFVLCVALEQRLGRFVCRCAREWADGRLSSAGCTLSWLLSVAWNRAAVLKQLAIRICAQLFDHSGEKLEDNAQRQLHHIVGIFHLLETLFENVVQHKWHFALNEAVQVNLQNDALKLECQYYDVLQWLVNVELLPEGLNPAVPYPAQDVAEFYHSRRVELKQLFNQQCYEENIQDFLLIDSLLRNQPGGVNVFSEWERDAGGSASPGAGQYPPLSLQALLRTFLVKDVSLEVKHSVVIYVLMDLANILDNKRYQATLQNFMQYPAAFGISVGSMRLTQAFWHLDHKAFGTALDMLLDPLLSVRDVELWQHRTIIRLLTVQGQANMALRYVRARKPPLQDQSDIRLHLSLLVDNDLIDEAFTYQRSNRSEENADALLLQFFRGCEGRNQLRTILQFSLDDEEEIAFSHYLESSRHPAADDLRVLYLLKRSRYVEALDVNQDLRKKGRSGGTRDAVVNGFYKTLPSVTRKLAAHCAQQQHKLKSWTQVDRPSPLFVNPKIASPQMRYKSSFLEAAVEKSRETWAKLVNRLPPLTSDVESTPFICTPRTKPPVRHRPSSSSLLPSTLCGAAQKRSREDDELEDFDSSKLKRSRFQKLETTLAELQQQEQTKSTQTRYSTYSCTDTLPLLQTPVVQRRSPGTRARLQQEIMASSPSRLSLTPQSIIKVRQSSITSKSGSPICQLSMAKENLFEPELTEEESESESSHKATKGESETDSDPGEDVNEEGPVGVTARRIIDFDSDISSDLSVSESSFDSQVSMTPSQSSMKGAKSNVFSDKSLSKMVVLSEARKIGKPVHSVTFGKGSICVYDQDEPVDAELSVQDESSNDTVDQEPSHDENIENESHDIHKDKDAHLNLSDSHNERDCSPYAKLRPFRLDTSGIGTMTSSDILADLTHSEESEVFHSADSSAQGSTYSPTFRKSLARPSVREIASRLTGTKRSHLDDEDDHSSDKLKDVEEVEVQVRKSARLEHVTTSASSVQQSDSSKKQDIIEEKSLRKSCSEAIDVVSTAGTSSSSLTGPIKNATRLSKGVHFSELQSSEDAELSPVESAFTDSKTNIKNAAENSKDSEKNQVESILSFVEEVGDKMGYSMAAQESHDSVEIVDLDDDAGDEGYEYLSIDPIIQEDDGNELNAGIKTSIATVSEDEDTGDKGFITENSNIFMSSNVDLLDSSSNSQSGSSQSRHEYSSEDTGSDQSKNDLCQREEGIHANQSITSDTLGHEVSKTNTDRDVAANAEKSRIEEVKLQDTNNDCRSFQIISKQSSDQCKEQHVPVSEVIDMDQDDMPTLRLETANSPESLSGSPKKTPLEMQTSTTEKSPIRTVELTNSEQTQSPCKEQEGLSGDVSQSLSSTPTQENRSPSKSSKRRSSMSSTTSETQEEGLSSKRVTRSQLKSQLLDQSFTSSSIAKDNVNENLKPTFEVVEQKSVSASARHRSRKGSASSADLPKDGANQSQIHLDSVSSVGSAVDESKKPSGKRPRRRNASASSQDPVAEKDEHKLDKILEEGSMSGSVGDKSKRRDPSEKTQSKQKIASDCGETSLESYETSRRLTRHQRALLARSMELKSTPSLISVPSKPSEQNMDGEAFSDDDDRMSQSTIRSSKRLRAKRPEEETQDSPNSTASTVLNPALTPVRRRGRHMSGSEASEMNRDVSPVSSVRRQRSIQAPATPSSLRSTPTRRSARLNAMHGGSQQSEDGDNHSVVSLTPSSVTSGKKSVKRRPSRRLSLSSETSEQYDFASPQVEHSNLNDNPDAEALEDFVFSPPKAVATPSKSRSSSTESSGSASKRNTRQSKALALQTIKEESSSSRITAEDTVVSSSPTETSGKRQSWFFIQPPNEDQEQANQKVIDVPVSSKKQGWHSAYPFRKKFSVETNPHYFESESDSSSGKSDELEKKGKPSQTTRQTVSNSKKK